MSAAWLAALALDVAFAEPPERVHPVALIGHAISALERRAPSHPLAQVAYGLVAVGVPALAAAAAGRAALRLRPAPLRALAALFLLKSSFALRALLDAGRRVERALAEDDLLRARRELRALVSRPVDGLDRTQISSAAIESLAENLSDSYVAPLVWYALGGLPAALAYRAVNTADAMIGYRGRYEHLGKAAARLDDLVNVAPARLAAVALVVAAPLARGRASRALATVRRGAAMTESPNAGWPMAAAAGALGLRLEKPGSYVLGDGRAPEGGDIGRARHLVALAALVTTILAVALDAGRRA